MDEVRKQYYKDYYTRNEEKLKKYKSEYYRKNKQKNVSKRKEYRLKNKSRDSSRKAAHKLKLKGKLGVIGRQFKDEIVEIYKQRKDGQHVDHIIPINGEHVTGLHVPWNLQIIDSSVNLSKNNRVDLERESRIQLSLSLKNTSARKG